MALVRLPGGMWVPTMFGGFSNNNVGASDAFTLDADEEECQFIGRVCLAGGSGSKTFGGGSTSIDWLPGASITFAADSTLRVGVKSTTIDDTNGPPGRATIGAAAFDVYDDLVGGTDTITSTTWRPTPMTTGTPFSVAHGDRLAVCFHLETTGGTPSVKVRSQATLSGNVPNFPVATLVTAGPTYAAQAIFPNLILIFSDGTIGWIDPTFPFSASSSETIGDTNLYGNIIKLPFDCAADAIAFQLTTGGTTNFDAGLWSDPAGTPTPMTNGTVSIDPNNMSANAARMQVHTLPAEVSLTKDTDYFAAIKQNSATALTAFHYDVANAAYFQTLGVDGDVYAGKSTAGAAVAQQASGLRRSLVWIRISSIDVSSGGGAAGMLYIPNLSGT